MTDAEREQRRAARAIYAKALRTGALVKPATCQNCGAVKRIHGHHHNGYGDPLDVQWLCQPCHVRAHHPKPGIKTLSLDIDQVTFRRLGAIAKRQGQTPSGLLSTAVSILVANPAQVLDWPLDATEAESLRSQAMAATEQYIQKQMDLLRRIAEWNIAGVMPGARVMRYRRPYAPKEAGAS